MDARHGMFARMCVSTGARSRWLMCDGFGLRDCLLAGVGGGWWAYCAGSVSRKQRSEKWYLTLHLLDEKRVSPWMWRSGPRRPFYLMLSQTFSSARCRPRQ